MTFATDIAKSASERYALVRLSPARNISDDLVLDTGNLYSMSFAGKPFSVVFEDNVKVTYTEDSDILTNLTDQTWYYNQDTQTLYVNTTDTIAVSTDFIYVLHYITLTDQQDIPLPVDPIVGGSTVIWQDRLKKPPKISSSIANMVDGTMTTTASSVSIENSDQAYNTWFSAKDTYNARAVDVWFSVDGTLAKIFSGTIQTIDITATTIVLGIVDKSTLFDDPAYMGSSKADSIYNAASHTIDTKHEGIPIPFVVRQSPSGEVQPNASTMVLKDSSGNEQPISILDTSKMLEGYCIDHTTTVSTSNNRDWMLCRTTQHNADTLSWGGGTVVITQKGRTANTLDFEGQGAKLLNISVTTAHNLQVGDTGEIEDSDLVGSYHTIVIKVVSSTNYWVMAKHPLQTLWSSDHIETTLSLPTNNRAVSIILVYGNGDKQIPVENKDFTVNYTNLDNGTRRVDLTFENNFEHINGIHNTTNDALTSTNCRLYYKFRTIAEIVHGTLVEQTLKGLDLTVNATSISNANAALTDGFTNGDCVMTIPAKGSSEHTTVRKILAEVLQSSIGYVRMDEDSEVYYELFDTPTGTKTRTDDDILSSSFIPRISYYDMYSKVNVDNKHIRAEDTLHPATYEFNEAQRLHKATKEKNLKTVFDRIPGDMSTRYDTFFGKPRLTYKWSTMSLDLDTSVGDYITLEATNLLGDVTSVDVVVTKTQKSTQGVTVTGLVVV